MTDRNKTDKSFIEKTKEISIKIFEILSVGVNWFFKFLYKELLKSINPFYNYKKGK